MVVCEQVGRLMSFLVTIYGDIPRTFEGVGEVTFTNPTDQTMPSGRVEVSRWSHGWDAASIVDPDGGNLVSVDTIYGQWPGVTDQPTYTKSGLMRLNLFGPQRWLEIRRVSPNRTMRGATAGRIFRRAILDAVAGLAPLPLTIGTVLEAPPLIGEMRFSGQTCLDVLQQLMNETGQSFWIDADWRIHWGEAHGVWHDGWWFDDGDLLRELQRLPLNEQHGEYIEIEQSGRQFKVARPGQPLLWPSQHVERV